MVDSRVQDPEDGQHGRLSIAFAHPSTFTGEGDFIYEKPCDITRFGTGGLQERGGTGQVREKDKNNYKNTSDLSVSMMNADGKTNRMIRSVLRARVK